MIVESSEHLPSPFHLEGVQSIEVRDKIFREVTANMLMHREFNSHYPARVIFEKGKVVAENGNRPHGFGHIDVNNFSPYPKNPIIARVFKEIGFADELGSGVNKIMRYHKVFSDTVPEFEENDLFKTTIYTDKVEDEKPADTDEKPADTGEKPAETIKDRQKEVVSQYLAMNQLITIKETEKILNLKRSRAKEILKSLVEEEFLELKGKARSTHYILKEK